MIRMRKWENDGSGQERPVRDRAGGGTVCSTAALWGVVLAGLVAGGGCSKSGEGKITGSSSAAPVSLQCFWQAGYTYRLRLELTQTTDLDKPESNETTQHVVTFDQDCLIKVTDGTRGGSLNLDMEILALGMERSIGGKKALSFDSEQGGETLDELGYIPVLKKLIGGHLRFQVSSNGTVQRADGISEWLDRAVRGATVVTMLGPPVLGPTGPTGPILEDLAGAEPAASPPAPVKVLRQGGKTVATTTAGGGGKIGSTLRSFFTQDHFKQMLEFPFLPSNPVRVGDTWPVRGETPVTTRGRFHYEAACKFEGWQMHQGTNCARIAVEGTLTSGNAPAPGAKPAGKPKTLTATVWINRALQFPVTQVLDKQIWVASDTNNRVVGTNRVANPFPLKVVHQHVATTLLSATPTETTAVAGEVPRP